MITCEKLWRSEFVGKCDQLEDFRAGQGKDRATRWPQQTVGFSWVVLGQVALKYEFFTTGALPKTAYLGGRTSQTGRRASRLLGQGDLRGRLMCLDDVIQQHSRTPKGSNGVGSCKGPELSCL